MYLKHAPTGISDQRELQSQAERVKRGPHRLLTNTPWEADLRSFLTNPLCMPGTTAVTQTTPAICGATPTTRTNAGKSAISTLAVS